LEARYVVARISLGIGSEELVQIVVNSLPGVDPVEDGNFTGPCGVFRGVFGGSHGSLL
jgi:hypothetical protein